MDASKLKEDICEPDVDVSQFMLNDLQLAAELGKTLLERNKDLEIMLKEHKTRNEEQQREILHLRKQINAMAEVNDTRLKVYEQLEVGIQDLERSNHRLTMEKSRDKKQIKSLGANIESLEARCEELNQQLDETRQRLTTERRKNEQPLQQERSATMRSFDQICMTKPWAASEREMIDLNATPIDSGAFAANANSTGVTDVSHANDRSAAFSDVGSSEEIIEAAAAAASKGEDNEELLSLITELESIRRDFLAEKQRCCELEEQLVAIIQENQTLQSRIAISSTNEEMMSMQDEFSLLDDVRQGQMCSRCLRVMEEQASINDGQSSVAQTEDGPEDDERSLLGSEFSTQMASNCADFSAKLNAQELLELKTAGSPNPYRDLVEKYEALLEVQRTSNVRKPNAINENGVQLSNQLHNVEEANPEQAQKTQETPAADVAADKNAESVRGRTSTEFSEAETSSSGFSEETSNKYTQTDERPGYFLCSISNGEECKLSIYDDVSPIDTHFQSRPEYRELFKEIFGVLKKAADNKDDGDKPKSSDEDGAQPKDTTDPVNDTAANEEFCVDFGDDTQSIISSVFSDQSFAMSECVTKLERKTAKKHINECKNQESRLSQASSTSIAQIDGNAKPDGIKTIEENGRVLTPLKREPLEYLSVGVGIKKRNRRKNRSLHSNGGRVESPLAQQPSPLAQPCPPHSARRTRKDFVPMPPEMFSAERVGRRPQSDRSSTEWNGSPMIIYNRNLNATRPKRTGRVIEVNGVEFHPNTVSQEFHKLKRLDLSYAEVLRRADACEHQSQPLRVQRMQQSRWNNSKSQTNRR